jgi:3-oxoacyl-[acyl-carrier protein] reductase
MNHSFFSTAAPPVVLITGASRGLGRGIAVHLAAAGCSVAVNFASNRAAAAETVSQCEAVRLSMAQHFHLAQADIGSREEREHMVVDVLASLGRLDALVNNAGIAPRVRADITEAGEASFEEVIRTNLQGPHFLTQRVVRHWLEHPAPSRLKAGYMVVFVTSISAHTASVNRAEYCMSKAGLSMAAQVWASRLASEGILVYEVRPGIMLTDMTSGVKERYDRLIADGLVPQRRWGTADDLGRSVRALVESALPYSTGAILDVDGGFQMRRL